MAGAGGTDKLKVFISYSRKDLKFADQLDAALDLTGFDAVIDRQGISGAEDWRRRLGDLIRDADTIVFVLSPSSAGSDVCAWEVEEAARLKKRIIPVICDPLGDVAPPPALQSLNYIFFYDEPKAPGSGFGAGLAALVRSLNTDLDWIREHTRLLARATEWEAGGRADTRLLFGSVIADAKAWMARRPKDAPEPTALHLDYIRASEQAEAQRHDEQRQQVERMAAAQDERAKALEDKEEAFMQVATAQRSRARIRNVALLGVTIFAATMASLWRQAEKQRAEAEERKSQAEVHLIMAREMTSLALLSGAQASIRTQTKSLNVPNIDFQVFRIEGEFVENVNEIIGNVASGRDNMTDQLKDIDKEARETVARNEEAFFKLAHGAAQILVGDARLAAGDVATAIGHYESGLESVNASMVKLNYYFEPNHLTQARGHGRIGAARQIEGNAAAAETAYKAGLALMEDAIAKGNSTPQVEGEKEWFTERLATLKGQPAAAAEAQGSPAAVPAETQTPPVAEPQAATPAP